MNVRHVLRSSMARTLQWVLAAGVSFFMMPFLVHHLGDRWYGLWVLVASLSTNYYLLDLGLASAVGRFVAKGFAEKDPGAVNTVVNTSLAIYMLLGMAIMACAACVAFGLRFWVRDPAELHAVRLVVLIVGLQIAITFPLKSFAGIVYSLVRHDLAVVSQVAGQVASTTLIVVMISQGHGIVALAAANFVGQQIANLVYLLVARRLFPALRLGAQFVTRPAARELLGYGGWSLLSLVANQLRFKTDAAVLAARLSPAAVTYYAVGQSLTEQLSTLLDRATNFMTPIFTGYWVEGRHAELREKFLLLTRVNLVLAAFGGGMVLLLGKAFIERWMGARFLVSYPVLVVLLAAMMLDFVGNHADNVFYALARHRTLAIINVLEAVSNLVLSLVLVRPLGLVGVALGTAIPLVVCRLAIIPLLVGRLLDIPPANYYRTVARIPAFTAVYLLAYGWLVQPWLHASYPSILIVGLSGTPPYLAAVALLGFTREERASAASILAGWLRRREAPLAA